MPSILRSSVHILGSSTTLPESMTRRLNSPAMVSDYHSREHVSIVGIAAGVSILVLIVVSSIFLIRRRQRRRSLATKLPKPVTSRLRWRKSADSESLTSFDTSTDTGAGHNGPREQAQLISKRLHEAINDVKQYSPTQECLFAARPAGETYVNTTNSLSLHSRRAGSSHFQQMRPLEQDLSFEDSVVPPHLFDHVVKLYSTLPSQYNSRPHSIPNPPHLSIQSPTVYKHIRSTSDSATVRQRPPFLPIINEIQPSADTSTSHSISAYHGSPYTTLVSTTTLPYGFPQPVQGTKPYRSSPRSSIRASTRDNTRGARGLLPFSAQPSLCRISDSGSIPLPWCPQAQILSPYPLNPWATSISPPGAHTPEGFFGPDRPTCPDVIYSPTIETAMLKRKTRPFREILSPSARTYRRGDSTFSARRHIANPSVHISAMAKQLPAIPAVQPPKPVLKLDTSSIVQTSNLQPMWYPNRSALATTFSPTLTAVRSAPAVCQSQDAYTFRTSVDQFATQGLELKTSHLDYYRPISNAATVGSSIPPQTDDMSEMSSEDDAVITPTTPLLPTTPLKHRQLRITTWKSAPRTTIDELGYPSPLTSELYPTDDEHDSNKRFSRSSSIAVPIVFKLSFPRKSSRKFNKMCWD